MVLTALMNKQARIITISDLEIYGTLESNKKCAKYSRNPWGMFLKNDVLVIQRTVDLIFVLKREEYRKQINLMKN